ncbi:MAG TPA: hypothetical protein VLJ37_06615 [bacterium]|nr:hypothetical protein [bacterium]
MSVLRIAPILILALLAGCLAETYPGVVVGNPDEEGTSVPGTPGVSPDFDFPNGGSYQPPPSDDPSSGDDPSTPGSVDKEPEEETTADAGDQEVPGGDRIGEPDLEDPPPTPSRPEYAQPEGTLPDSIMMVQEN